MSGMGGCRMAPDMVLTWQKGGYFEVKVICIMWVMNGASDGRLTLEHEIHEMARKARKGE